MRTTSLSPHVYPQYMDSFRQAMLEHVVGEATVNAFLKNPSKTNKMIADYEQSWRKGFDKRSELREIVRNQIEHSHSVEAGIKRGDLKKWEEAEKKINTIFIKWHCNKRFFNEEPV